MLQHHAHVVEFAAAICQQYKVFVKQVSMEWSDSINIALHYMLQLAIIRKQLLQGIHKQMVGQLRLAPIFLLVKCIV